MDNGKKDVNYIGSVPGLEDFKDLSHSDYEKYCKDFLNKEWNLRNEAIKYCEQDTKTLFFIIKKFSKFIFDKFRLDITIFPTLSSLALGIFRKEFLKKSKLPIISGKMYNEIQEAYTGGNVDVYIPFGENLYYYDVNSLYPYIMWKYPMPVGEPKLFIGNILDFEKRPFGLFKVEVTAPSDLNIPLLQHKFKTKLGSRTITPLGTWTGTYTSDEVYKGMELGYKFKILKGYTFKQKIVFKEFVDYFYQMKKTKPRNSSEYTIAKLILNSLYGRLGMNPYPEIHCIIDKSELVDFHNNNVITNVVSLSEDKDFISMLNNKMLPLQERWRPFRKNEYFNSYGCICYS